jgi:hypothetical protein
MNQPFVSPWTGCRNPLMGTFPLVATAKPNFDSGVDGTRAAECREQTAFCVAVMVVGSAKVDFLSHSLSDRLNRQPLPDKWSTSKANAGYQTVMAVAGHVSQMMLVHYPAFVSTLSVALDVEGNGRPVRARTADLHRVNSEGDDDTEGHE